MELERFDEFDAYEEIPDEGQKLLGTTWVLTEKVKAGEDIVKARLVVRGDQEIKDDIETDSPTVRKGNIGMVLMLAARNSWRIKSQDVTCAFLQSSSINRDVFIRPPLEKRIPGVIWKLRKTVYGLVDASRGFYLNFSNHLLKFGCTKSKLDPAMFLYYEDEDKDVKEPSGIAVMHVDDIMSAGEEGFETKVMDNMKSSFKFGSEEETISVSWYEHKSS